MYLHGRFIAGAVVSTLCVVLAGAQAGRRSASPGTHGLEINVVATRNNGSTAPVTAGEMDIFDDGIEQSIQSFSPNPAPSRIVLLVDNSLTIRADVKKLEDAARQFAYEIFEGDKILIIGYDEEADIIADWTDDAKSIETSLKSFRKKGEPHLFDALYAVTDQALAPLASTSQKRAIVVISDGLDRGSKTHFEQILARLQLQDDTVYAVQATDRTGGALRRDVPKPVQVIQKLVDGTGGRTFPISNPQAAAKSICDELKKNRYLLYYAPSSIPFGETRRLLVLANDGITVRAKTNQPPVVSQ